MSMVRCSQCQAAFSSHRAACPSCGAVRNKGGARLKKKSGFSARTLITILLIVAIAVCLVVLAFMFFGGDDSSKPAEDSQLQADNTPSTTPAIDISNADTIQSEPDDSDVGSSEIEDDGGMPEIDVSAPEVTSITMNVYFYSQETGQYDMSLAVGETYTFVASTSPDSASVTWTSSNDAVVQIQSDGTAVATGTGNAIITAAAGDVTAECIVRVG